MRALPITGVLLLILIACSAEKAMEIKQTLKVGQNDLYYEVCGDGDAIVFIHGAGVDLGMWDLQADYFCGEYKVIRFDVRGHGRSNIIDNDSHNIDDLAALVDNLGVERFNLVGLSMGAMLAVDFVLAYPKQVNKLVLISPGLANFQEKEDSYIGPIRKIGDALSSGNHEIAFEVIDSITFNNQTKLDFEDIEEARAYLRQSVMVYIDREAYLKPVKLNELNPVSRLGEIACPTLVMHGASDLPYIQKNAAKLYKSIRNSARLEYPNAAHLLNVQRANEVNEAIYRFLDTDS